jgi:hypothetical protein
MKTAANRNFDRTWAWLPFNALPNVVQYVIEVGSGKVSQRHRGSDVPVAALTISGQVPSFAIVRQREMLSDGCSENGVHGGSCEVIFEAVSLKHKPSHSDGV